MAVSLLAAEDVEVDNAGDLRLLEGEQVVYRQPEGVVGVAEHGTKEHCRRVETADGLATE